MFRGFLCTRILVPGGVIGVQLKINPLFICVYANSIGFNLEGPGRFGVIYACLSKRYQFFIGKYVSVAHSTAMK